MLSVSLPLRINEYKRAGGGPEPIGAMANGLAQREILKQRQQRHQRHVQREQRRRAPQNQPHGKRNQHREGGSGSELLKEAAKCVTADDFLSPTMESFTSRRGIEEFRASLCPPGPSGRGIVHARTHRG